MITKNLRVSFLILFFALSFFSSSFGQVGEKDSEDIMKSGCPGEVADVARGTTLELPRNDETEEDTISVKEGS